MKICKAKWENHPVLGNFELDFTKADGTPYSTIILAGENGTGKTSILDSLYDFCDFNTSKYLKEITLQGNEGKIVITSSFYPSGNGRGFTATFENGDIEDWNACRSSSASMIGTFEKDPRNDGTTYSSAQSIYQVNDISSIAANELDKFDVKNTKKEFTPQELKQLLIDISAQDNADYARMGAAHPDAENKFNSFESNSRIFRFKKAFNDFFLNGINFDSIKTVDGKHEVLFKKNGKSVAIGNLSTGESQIVFRGGSLLKDIGNLDKGIAFLDEPEISLHPLWQKKILGYYKGLFGHGGSVNGQLIVATHSTGVLEEALEDATDSLIVILRQRPDGSIVQGKIEKPAALNFTTAAEINYQAFNTASTDYHNALYGYIEAEGWLPDYKLGKPQLPYVREVKDRRTGTVSLVNDSKILSEKIRHIIHHPENRHNSYSEPELHQSIEAMRTYILNHP